MIDHIEHKMWQQLILAAHRYSINEVQIMIGEIVIHREDLAKAKYIAS